MPFPEKDALPPSYIESQSLPHHHPPSSYSRGPLLSQLSTTRTTHITSIITTHILPLIESRASYGIAQTTIALLPSDIPLPPVPEKSEFSFDDFTPATKAVEVIGFSSEDEPQIVRLEGQMNRTEFWRVQAVIAELEGMLRETLNQSEVLRSPTSPTRVRAGEGRAPRRGLLSRIMPSLGPEERSPSGNPEVGVRREESGVGMVLVKARLEELCLRTVTEFGLYDTMSKQCVIVRVDARC
ncbi:hypothetical protein BKA63DRAFT_211716 [Paraphoma chrysanthemicola]|nr:hypothetical protein BKA63DRAFT_211716 [Paraphoma chrysanthemicola]